jgi:predicted naringenin-chalcone synthase
MPWTWIGPRGWLVGAFSQSLSALEGVAVTTPAPVLVRYLAAVTSALAASEALIASTTCAAVLVIAPASSVAACTVIVVPATVTVSGLLAPSLTISALRLLPPSWPQAREVRTTALGWSAAATDVAPAYGAAIPRIVCALR